MNWLEITTPAVEAMSVYVPTVSSERSAKLTSPWTLLTSGVVPVLPPLHSTARCRLNRGRGLPYLSVT